ncbi:Anti-sigma-K factor rskA [Flavobacteriaceae bacterium MAR_2010_188]|nr:Anti-sigma-K factor rskA [Flavobacteriaceae bacterium MAR_2010_188]
MDYNAYIESGILELYIAGVLSEEENREVYDMMLKHPEVLQEVLEIEAAVLKLTAAVSPGETKQLFPNIKKRINHIPPVHDTKKETKVVTLDKPRYDWLTYTGWAAAILFGAGLLWLLNTNNDLENRVVQQEMVNGLLETQVADAKNNLESTMQLLTSLRAKDIISVPLAGQGNFQNTYAKVYWDKTNDKILLDAQGLPEPPRGKVYQVWSLTLSPLTPTSLGTLDSFIQDDNKIFSIDNALESEAFGITLEPEGGSPGPTMEQLYTLGAVSSPGQ